MVDPGCEKLTLLFMRWFRNIDALDTSFREWKVIARTAYPRVRVLVRKELYRVDV